MGITVSSNNGVVSIQAGGLNTVPTGEIQATNVQDALSELDAEKAPRGNLVINTTGGTTILTATQFSKSSFEVVGVLTSNAIIIIPDGIAQSFVVSNSTTGAFTVTVKHNATLGVAIAQTAIDVLFTDGTIARTTTSSSAVASVHSRTGNVVSVSGDYSATQITNTPSGSLLSVNVQAAINELDVAKASSAHTHNLASITDAGTVASLDVGIGANQVVQLNGTGQLPAVDGSNLTNLPSAPVTSVFGRSGAVVKQANDYTWADIDKTVSSLTNITSRSHTLLTDVGTNTHAQIDTHIANVSNPHSVTAVQVGSATAQWNAIKIRDIDINALTPTDGQVLTYDFASTSYKPITPSGGDALVSGNLSQFAPTTSVQLLSVISDETGTGSLVFNTSPSLITPNIGVAVATSLSTGTLTTTDAVVVGGSFIHKRIASPSDTVTGNKVIIGITDTTLPRVVTLQTADAIDGKIYIIKDESGNAGLNNITINTQGVETIDGVTSLTIFVNYGVARIYSDGTNFFTY